jgi:hypothetical protein
MRSDGSVAPGLDQALEPVASAAPTPISDDNCDTENVDSGVARPNP